MLPLLLASTLAYAEPGTHAPALSTWDTRASSIVGSVNLAAWPGGSLRYATYSTNFSSTNGNLSSQFGVSWVTHHEVRESDNAEFTSQGAAAAAVTAYSFRLTKRWESGLPRVAVMPYAGPVPTVTFGGAAGGSLGLASAQTRISLPFVLGVGVPLAPVSFGTVTPYFEYALGGDADATIEPGEVEIPQDVLDSGRPLTEAEFQDMLSQGITYKFGFATSWRAGLAVAVHAKRFDLNVILGAQQVGWAERPQVALNGGAGVAFHWDKVVPAVLPSQCPTCPVDDGSD